MDPKRRRDDRWIAAAAVGATALAFLLPALIRGEGLLPTGSLWRVPPWNGVLTPTAGNGLLSDQLLNFWPWRLFLRSELLAGRFPFWNPLIAGGVPFAANAQTATFFPTTLLLLALPPAAWSVVTAFLKIFVAGWFTALFVRRLGADRAGQALAGVAFAACGFMIAWLGHPHANVACLLPAFFWSLAVAVDEDAPRSWVAVSIAIALILLGGHPPTALHVLAAGAAYLLYRRRDLSGRFGLSALAGIALAAPALLPYFEYLSWSSTAASAAHLARWSTRLSPWSLLHLLMPLASGSPTHGAEMLAAAFGLGPESNFLERAGWVGLPAMGFAALAVYKRRSDREIRFHFVLALIGILAALGVPPLPWMWRLIPGFSAANPTRLLLLFCFSTSVLAGLACKTDDEPVPSVVRNWFLGIMGFALGLDLVAVLRNAGSFAPGELGFAFGQAVAFVLEAVAAVWLLSRPNRRPWAALIAGLFLLRVGLGLNPTAPESTLYPRTPGIDALASVQGEGRVFGLGAALAPDSGMPVGLRDARGRDFASLRRYEELVTGRAGDFDFYQSASELPAVTPLLAISAVAATPKSVGGVPADWPQTSGGDLLVFRAPNPPRRAWFVPEARTGLPKQVFDAVREPGFDPTSLIWLDDWFVAPVTSGGTGDARIDYEDSQEVIVFVRATKDGWLLLLDGWYPGWRATVNGAPAPVRRADYAFRAVPVPKGESIVRFTFVPFSFWIGLFAALCAAVGLGVAWRR